jgi:tetratricopeptide (TPR) repeat protein
MRKTVCACLGLVFWWALAATAAHAQEDIDSRYKSADTNNAVIRGRVTLPSGYAAKRHVKITLRNAQSVLSTNYTNENGEFEIMNLSEGVYYVQAEVQDESFEPAAAKVALGRGLVAQLTLELGEKAISLITRSAARVVSVAELRQVVPAAAKKEYEAGLKLVSKGDFQQAAIHFQAALNIYPEYLAARNDLGAQYLKLKQLDEAEKHFQIVIGRDPKNFNAKFNLGLVRIERKDYLDAISQLSQAIVIDSTRPVARLWLGVAQLETGDMVNAELELTKALVMGGEECLSAQYHLARIYFARGDAAQALRSVQSYLEDAPKGEYAKDARQLEQKIQSQAKSRPGR